MKEKINTLDELRRLKGIKIIDISKVMSRQTYYNVILAKHGSEKTMQKLCDLFQIDMKSLEKLLKSSKS